jgi:hypothetical protein
MSTPSTAPVFVIGAGRSGTTLFFDMLTRHPAFGFFTNYDDILAATPLFGMSRPLFENAWWRMLGKRKNWKTVNDYSSLLPRKTEAYRFWARYCFRDFTHGYLWHVRPSPESASIIRAKIGRLMRLQRRQVFAAKLTGPGRIAYLREIFPDARFIHLVRDARAQVHSTLNVGFWQAGEGDKKLWWSSDIPETHQTYLNAAEQSGDPLILATAQWRSVVESIRIEAGRILPIHDFMELSYEDLVADPVARIAGIWGGLGLPVEDEDLACLSSVSVRRGNNVKWLRDFELREQELLQHWLERALLRKRVSG